MRNAVTIVTGLFAAGMSSAALVGSGMTPWDDSATPWDVAVNELYGHLEGSGNLYHTPDGGENRFFGGTTIGPELVAGNDILEVYNLATQAAEINVFGIRIQIGADSYELTLGPTSVDDAATDHYFGTVNDILAASGGPMLAVAGVGGATTSEIAKLDFYINNITEGVRIYSSEIGSDPDKPVHPAFDFTADLLEPAGPSGAKPLPASAVDALAFLNDGGFKVWGMEDSPQSDFSADAGEPDFNDRIFAYRLVAVPEPSTYGLIGAATLAGLVGFRTRRRLRSKSEC